MTFEGTEGAGKTTLIQAVATRLRADGHEVITTREPGGSGVAEKIRALILENEMDAWTELFLYEAARAEHLACTVRPALERGAVVLCDRFTDSSLAYQAHARGLPWKDVQALNRFATRGLEPDLTVLLDIDPALGLARAREQTRFEAEGLAFQKKVRLGFLKSLKEKPRRWLRLKPGARDPEALAELVWAAYRKKTSSGKRGSRG
jgi:dTMP kinase